MSPIFVIQLLRYPSNKTNAQKIIAHLFLTSPTKQQVYEESSAIRKTYFLGFIFMLLVCAVAAQDTTKNKWLPLFDGKTLNGWRAYQNKPMDSWAVSNGELYNKGNADTTIKHADLVTEAQFENFQLNIDWKIAPQANSGILYMVNEGYPSSYQSGPEYQLIDDKGYPGKLENWQKTGANYAMDPPLLDATKPVGEWNRTVIIVDHGKVEHWLNGKKSCCLPIRFRFLERTQSKG